MATIGVDCNVIISGTGYMIKDNTWAREKPRIITSRVTKTGQYRYVEKGPLFTKFSFTILIATMPNFSGGGNYASTPNTLRSGLWTLYNNVNNSFTLTTPYSENYTVIFKDLKERILNIGNISSAGLEFEMDCQFEQIS